MVQDSEFRVICLANIEACARDDECLRRTKLTQLVLVVAQVVRNVAPPLALDARDDDVVSDSKQRLLLGGGRAPENEIHLRSVFVDEQNLGTLVQAGGGFRNEVVQRASLTS